MSRFRYESSVLRYEPSVFLINSMYKNSKSLLCVLLQQVASAGELCMR
jgi:hypothetical protein